MVQWMLAITTISLILWLHVSDMALLPQLQTHLPLLTFGVLELGLYRPHFCFARGILVGSASRGPQEGTARIKGREGTWLPPVGFLFASCGFSVACGFKHHPSNASSLQQFLPGTAAESSAVFPILTCITTLSCQLEVWIWAPLGPFLELWTQPSAESIPFS